MSMEDVGNDDPLNDASFDIEDDAPELAELDREFAEFETDYGVSLGDGDTESADPLAALEAAIAGTEFADGGSRGLMEFNVLDLADGRMPAGMESMPEGFWPSVKKILVRPIARKAKKLIRKLVGLVRKYRKYAPCAPAVMKAVAAFKAKQYGTAIKAGYSAYRCIRSKR
ncbi:MAG: hypothetical protein AAF714_00260 [Pseudomonadota bacterium]